MTDTRMSEFIALQVDRRLERLTREIRSSSKSPKPERVHDLRVAIRRFVTSLEEFPQFFPEKAVKKVRKRLGKLRRFGGDIRDRDIALNLAREADLSKKARLPRKLARQRKKAAKKLKKQLRGWPEKKIASSWRKRLQLEELATNHYGIPAADSNGDAGWSPQRSAEDNAAVLLPMQVVKFFRSGREVVHSKPKAVMLHQLRLEAKRLRYTLELFRPCYSPELDLWLGQLRQLQDHLGSINDCRATQDLLKQKGFKEVAGAKDLRRYLDEVLQGETAAFVSHWQDQFDSSGQEQAWTEFLRNSENEAIAAD